MAKQQQFAGMVYVAPLTGTTAMTAEGMTNTGDGLTWRVTAAAKRYWDPTAALTVYDNGSPVASGYTVQYCGGLVTFAASKAGHTITVTGKYLPYARALTLRRITQNHKTTLQESSPLVSQDEEYDPVGAGGDGTLEYVDIDAYYADLLGDLLVLVSHVSGTYNAADSSGPRWEAYIRLAEDSFDLAKGELTKEVLTYNIEREHHYRAA
jgi:hypothetical protein